MTASARVLLVGAGAMGARHARIIASSGAAELAGVVDLRREVGEGVASRYDAPWHPELPDLDGIDAVVVATATETHFGIASEVLGAGKSLLVEKPVCDSLDRSRELLELAESRGVPIMCGLAERFNPAVRTARALIEAPVRVSAVRHSPYAPRILTGVGWDLLVHDVDLAVGFIGSAPVDVRGVTGRFDPRSQPGAEDVADVVMTFAGGQLANVSASRIGQRKIRRVSVTEVDRLIEIDLLRRDVTVYRNRSDEPADDSGRGYRFETTIEIPEILEGREPLAAQFDHFLDLIAGRVDIDAERASILPSHEVVEQLKNSSR